MNSNNLLQIFTQFVSQLQNDSLGRKISHIDRYPIIAIHKTFNRTYFHIYAAISLSQAKKILVKLYLVNQSIKIKD